MKKRVTLPDTNFILRYLLRDNEAHFTEASEFFEKVRNGKTTAMLCEAVLIECLYVLTKYYKVPRLEASQSLHGIMIYKGITNPNREILTRALELYAESNLDPVDCLLVTLVACEGHEVRSFDQAIIKKIAQGRQSHE
jgi:predicted nucleic-acid-binding protein